MSKYIGSTLVAGVGRNTERNANYLLDFKWSDHIINSMEWLRADTFSWQSGSVYTSAYNHLVADATGSLQSETVAGVTVQFYLASDGHKICPANQESNVEAIYAATGIAWYYIFDTANTRFKLPRTKFGFTGLRDTVGKYVEAGLPNITGSLGNNAMQSQSKDTKTASGAFSITKTGEGNSTGGSPVYSVSFDASRSSSIYGNSDTVQPKATQMYLYFYVGQYTQSAIEQTAGITSEELNQKVDKGHEVIEFQAPNVGNNYTWYRLYADGWVEQGGHYSGLLTAGQSTTVSLPITMSDTNYTVSITGEQNSNQWAYAVLKDGSATTTTIGIFCGGGGSSDKIKGAFWWVSGKYAI